MADPILHGGVAGHTLDVRWALDSPVHRPDRGTRKRLRVSSVRNAEETWLLQGSDGVGLLQRSSHQSGSEKSPRSWYGGTRHPGLGDWRRVGAHGPSTEPTSFDKAGATQERCRSWRTRISHVDAVADLVERVRNEILKSLSRFSQRVTRVEVHLSDHNADRGGHEFGISRATGRVVSAFRRGSFEVTVWDGRPLSCRGSRG